MEKQIEELKDAYERQKGLGTLATILFIACLVCLIGAYAFIGTVTYVAMNVAGLTLLGASYAVNHVKNTRYSDSLFADFIQKRKAELQTA